MNIAEEQKYGKGTVKGVGLRAFDCEVVPWCKGARSRRTSVLLLCVCQLDCMSVRASCFCDVVNSE